MGSGPARRSPHARVTGSHGSAGLHPRPPAAPVSPRQRQPPPRPRPGGTSLSTTDSGGTAAAAPRPRTFPDELLAVRLVTRAVAAPPEPRHGGVEAAAAVRVQRGGSGGGRGGGRGAPGQERPRGSSAERQVRAGRRHGAGRVAALVAEAAAALAMPPRVCLVPGVGADSHGQEGEGGGGQEQPGAAQRLSRGRHLTAPGAAGAGASLQPGWGRRPRHRPRKGRARAPRTAALRRARSPTPASPGTASRGSRNRPRRGARLLLRGPGAPSLGGAHVQGGAGVAAGSCRGMHDRRKG